MSHKVGSSRLVTGSHSYLGFDLLEQADPGALVQAIANLRELRTTTGGVNLVVAFGPPSGGALRHGSCQRG
jgi:porphyrinogen peroxidase